MTQFKALTKKHIAKSAVAVGSLVAAGSAMATETTTVAQDAMAQMETEATSMIDAAWPIAVTIMAGLIGIKLFKKFANRAS